MKCTLLKFLSKNYDIKKNLYGIESKPIYKKLKKNNFFFRIYNSFLDNFYPRKKFDFLILDNVFEHFDFPNKSLDKLHNLIKKRRFYLHFCAKCKSYSIYTRRPI